MLHSERLFGNVCLILDLAMVSAPLFWMVTMIDLPQKIIEIFEEICDQQVQLYLYNLTTQ